MVRIFILEDMEERIETFLRLLDGKDANICIARSYDEALKCMEEPEGFDLAFLDHDLSVQDIMCDPIKGGVEKTGTDFVGWLVNSKSIEDMPKRIIIHSMNPVGSSSMKKMFNRAGHVNVDVVPFPQLVRRQE